ncbi:FMN-dependent dehydrogenase [Xylariomycetidae sp. FL2044]|nr:FMN-dependent dehydrogenase [Xylariomycetidae sp. FL2044]
MANRGRTYDQQVACIKDLERLGSAKLLKSYREYYNEGAMDLITLRANESAYDRYQIRPRVMRNISELDTSTTFFGTKVRFPFGFSPTAMHKMAHPDGELATSRAAASCGIPMGLSNYSTVDLETVIGAAKGNPYGIQMSLLKNRDVMIQLIRRAEKAGYKALLVTLDVPYLGRRLNEFRNNFGVPEGMEYPNLYPGVDVSNLEDSKGEMGYDSSIEWAELMEFCRKHTKMQVWGKGIYTPEDAELAIRHGLDGIIVSNHGGRQLDSVPSSLDVLKEIAPIAKGRIPIAVDGGIRRGTDIFKALALGADFCLAGRIAIWGLAYDGERGVELAINLLYDEFKTCMALAGCKSVREITPQYLSLLQPNGVLAKL